MGVRVRGSRRCLIARTAAAAAAGAAVRITRTITHPHALHRAAELVAARRRGCETLDCRFEAPLKEAVRSVRSVTAVCADRAALLSTHLAAKHDLDSRKVCCGTLRHVVCVWVLEARTAGVGVGTEQSSVCSATAAGRASSEGWLGGSPRRRSCACGPRVCAASGCCGGQVKWAKLRGTPGSPPERLAEAEREVSASTSSC
jgi:hypothetical protein